MSFRITMVAITFVILFENITLVLISCIDGGGRAVSEVSYDSVYLSPRILCGITPTAKDIHFNSLLWDSENDHWVGLQMEWPICDPDFLQDTRFYLFL